MYDIKTIVCPVDFSPGSDRAADHAVSIAQKYGAALHLLHIYPIDVFVGPDGGLTLTPEIVKRIVEEGTAGLEKIAAPHRSRGVDVHIDVRDGIPAEEIVRHAERLKADLIVVGTHGRTGLSRMLVGSVAERVVRTAHIPVLTVRLAD